MSHPIILPMSHPKGAQSDTSRDVLLDDLRAEYDRVLKLCECRRRTAGDLGRDRLILMVELGIVRMIGVRLGDDHLDRIARLAADGLLGIDPYCDICGAPLGKTR